MTSPQEFLDELDEIFAAYAGKDRTLNLAEFQQCLKLRNPYFASRIFALCDPNGNGVIDYQEFKAFVLRLVAGTNEEKLNFAYRLHDSNDDGHIDRSELSELIAASLSENQLSFPPQQVTDLVEILWQEADTDDNQELSLAEFKTLLGKSPALLQAMTVSPESWLKPRQSSASPLSWRERWQLKKIAIAHYCQNNWVKILFLVLYFGINALLFWEASNRYASQGANLYIQMARGCGAALNFNGALILIPVMRNLMVWLRRGFLNHYLPIDEHLEFHKLVGQVMFALAIAHTMAHILNYATLPVPVFHSLLQTKAGLSGLLLLLILIGMWVTAQVPMRRKYFNLFYIAHLGYLLWFVLLLIHGPVFWKWASVSLLGFAIEQVIRHRRTKHPTQVVNATLLPGKVLGLEVERPAAFDFQPSDYVYVKCPAISRFEWHPFSISSAPEQRDILSLHIRAIAAGSWTGRLYEQFHQQRQAWVRAGCPKLDLGVSVYLDGPYGSPSSYIFRATYAVLIAGGIGVTPFASILKSILSRKKQRSAEMNLKKVHFYWLNSEQRSFEWFVELLRTLEAEDTDDLFDINLYLTGARARADMTACTLYTAMDLLYAQTHIDLITGLKSPTKTGRPDWRAIFQDLATQYRDRRLDVFFCGPPGLSSELKKLCDQFGFNYRKENF